jgi:BolA protein
MSRKNRIQNILNLQLSSTVLIIEDESYKHQRPGIETHFKIIAVSPQFEEMTRIARHRVVNELLLGEFNLGLHALSLHLYTPEEWEKRTSLPTTPNCNSKGNT